MCQNSGQNQPDADKFEPILASWIDWSIDRLFGFNMVFNYHQVSNISHTLGNIVDRSDVVGASPVGVAPTTSSFST